MTKECGFGVRTLEDVPAGSFVALYVGEILTDHEAKERQDSSYHAVLRNPKLASKKPFVMDGRHKTNIAAFFNHSCEPSMFAQMVFTESRVDKLPELALFAKKDIKAHEVVISSSSYWGRLTVEERQFLR